MSMCGEIENLQRERDKLEEELFALAKKINDIEDNIIAMQLIDSKVNDPITDIDVKEFN
jgi:septal ring factor EnvC (AmiA/AmiB activator)|tara:strand:+ start:70 stop:246 length:177 start_codon:yes stop_codon:yes gene_type:complete